MTEEDAKQALDVPRETFERLEAFVRLLLAENGSQNLISAASANMVWSRHILDSAQLVRLAPSEAKSWLDIGSGAGLPGLVAALLHPAHFTLAEPRKLRVNFLERAAALLGIGHKVTIFCSKVEALSPATFDIISARAFAPLPSIFASAEHLASPDTRWVLPKGRNAKTELEDAESLWQGNFRLEPSLTDDEAQIVVADHVRRKPRGRRGR